MTGGTVLVLGEVGSNFGAGFTGGMAFVYDAAGTFEVRVNPDTLPWQRLGSGHWEAALRALVEEHARETSSRYAAMLLHDWAQERDRFWQVVPKEFVKYLAAPLRDTADALRA